jgi:putative ATPase
MSGFFEDEEQLKPVKKEYSPLADRVRPESFNEIVGQGHLVGENAPLTKFAKSGNYPSMIFWGPPGVGKTTFAYIIAKNSGYLFSRLSAVEAGVKEVREIICNAERLRKSGKKTLLFIDEIHRFNKSQQDALLHAVEKGIITLIGATTENPSFEVNSALLSRCRVYKLFELRDEDIKTLIINALKTDEFLLKFDVIISDWDSIINISGGDARTALNILETAVNLSVINDNGQIIIDKELIEKSIQQKIPVYDKAGESHYDTISAFIKSLRGSDPDAAVFWLAKMIESGEDPKFIARRMVVFASEDIGNADPQALIVAVSVFQAVTFIGLPECVINLSQGVTYLASAPKSNASYLAVKAAQDDIKNGINASVPIKLRNAPTKLMKQEGYGKEYKYPHDFDGHFVDEKYFPDDSKVKVYYKPTDIGKENEIKLRLEKWWIDRY